MHSFVACLYFRTFLSGSDCKKTTISHTAQPDPPARPPDPGRTPKPPMAAPADHGLAAIRDSLTAVLQGLTDYSDLRKILFSKLMLAGEGRAGKTSLLKALLGMPFSPEEASTIGADTLDNVDAANWQQQKMHGMLGRNLAAGKEKTVASDARKLDAEMQRELYDAPLPDHGGTHHTPKPRHSKHAGAGRAHEGQKGMPT